VIGQGLTPSAGFSVIYLGGANLTGPLIVLATYAAAGTLAEKLIAEGVAVPHFTCACLHGSPGNTGEETPRNPGQPKVDAFQVHEL
jgi:hypothetical protein